MFIFRIFSLSYHPLLNIVVFPPIRTIESASPKCDISFSMTIFHSQRRHFNSTLSTMLSLLAQSITTYHPLYLHCIPYLPKRHFFPWDDISLPFNLYEPGILNYLLPWNSKLKVSKFESASLVIMLSTQPAE